MLITQQMDPTRVTETGGHGSRMNATYDHDPLTMDGFFEKHYILLPTESNHLKIRKTPILPIFPISKFSWWDGVKKGKYPKPIKISGNITVWKSDEIQNLINKICNQ